MFNNTCVYCNWWRYVHATAVWDRLLVGVIRAPQPTRDLQISITVCGGHIPFLYDLKRIFWRKEAKFIDRYHHVPLNHLITQRNKSIFWLQQLCRSESGLILRRKRRRRMIEDSTLKWVRNEQCDQSAQRIKMINNMEVMPAQTFTTNMASCRHWAIKRGALSWKAQRGVCNVMNMWLPASTTGRTIIIKKKTFEIIPKQSL